MKRLFLIVAVAALALTVVAPLAAAKPGGGSKNGHYRFNVVGKLVADPSPATDTTPASLLIKVKGGSHIKGLDKAGATFYVAAEPTIVQLTADGVVTDKSLADLAEGDWVKVRGIVKVVKDGDKVVSRTYTIKHLKYKDLTEEVTPPVTPTP